MQNFDLNAYGVSELNGDELMNVEGGSLKSVLCAVGKALQVIGDVLESVGEWLENLCCDC